MLLAGLFIVLAFSVSIYCFYTFRQDVPLFEVISGTPAIPDSEYRIPAVIPATLPERIPDKTPIGKLAFVIDDAGNNLRELEPFLRFPGLLTIAVLPGLPNSAEAARLIRAAGKEVFLHQPMESLGGRNPGPSAIFSGMDEAEIRMIINRNLDEIWPVSGMNNHEGSKITGDKRIMEIILDICRQREIVFLDSRTTADTVVPVIAANMNVRIAERDVFLDNEHDRNAIIGSLDSGLARAGQKGGVVMIGHASTGNLAPILDEFYSQWINLGYVLSPVSGL